MNSAPIPMRLLCCLVCGLLLLSAGAACRPAPGGEPAAGVGSVSGQVLASDGAPAVGAYVYAYRTASKGLRGPADFATRADVDGRYTLDVVAGSYHLVARQRQAGGSAGPPRAGDAWAVLADNPVQIDRPAAGRYDFRLQTLSGVQQVRQGSLTSGETGFTGRLTDAAGQALEGGIVLAYRSSDLRGMPDFTSLPAGPDGRFQLYLPEPGRYCLAARKQTRGQPREGEPYGLLGQGEAGCRTLGRGEIRDVGRIVLRPFRR